MQPTVPQPAPTPQATPPLTMSAPVTQPPSTSPAKSEKNTFSAQLGYIMKYHKVGFLITIGAVLLFWTPIIVFWSIAGQPVTVVIMSLFFMLFAVGIWFGIAHALLERQLYADFAAQHNYTFIATPAPFPLPIPVEGLGYAHRSFNCITGDYPGAVQFSMFTHEFTVGSGKNSTTYKFCATSLVLPGNAPHLYLEGASMESIIEAAIEASFHPVKKYSLEGDFDKHYKLYGDDNNEVNLLEVLNPASMEKLMQVTGYSLLLNANVLTYIRRQEPQSTEDLEHTLAVGQYFLSAFAHTVKEMSSAATLEAAQPQQ